MRNEILKRIKLSEEILSVLPKNNDSNTIVYINEANKIYANYNAIKLQLIEEMKSRIINTNNLVRDVDEIEVNFDELNHKINMLNTINTPYEKLNLDKTLYNLSKYYKSDLNKVNEEVYNAIEVFKTVGITLKEEDFFYDEYQKAYMKELLSLEKGTSLASLKHSFEDYYWRSPNIIQYIQLNLKSLYHKNYKLFDKYVIESNKTIQRTLEEAEKEYRENKLMYDLEIDMKPKIFLDKFMNEELELKDYSETNVTKISESLFENDITSKSVAVYNLFNTLKEYEGYLKFKPIIDKITLELQNKVKEKLNSNKKLKEITILEKKLYSLNRKKKVKNKKLTLDDLTGKIKVLYDEFDDIYYKEKLYEFLDEDSKIIDALKFVVSFYEYFIKLTKKDNDKIGVEEIESNLKELKELIFSPYNNIINNLVILGEKNIAMIITDKYKLDNIKLDPKTLEEDSLGVLIHDVEILSNYCKIKTLKSIEMEIIYEYLKLSKILSK